MGFTIPNLERYRIPLVAFLAIVIPFAAYFLRSDFIGMDSYGFLLLVCQNNNTIMDSGVTYLLFSSLPCNFLVLKGLLFVSCFVSFIFIAKMATLFSPKNGWRAAYLLLLSGVAILEFTKFENDAFAFPFLFASQYFFFKSFKKSDRQSLFLSIALLLPAGLLWQGAVYYIFAYALHFWFIIIPLFLMTLIPTKPHPLRLDGLLGNVIRTSTIAEDMPFRFHLHFILLFGIVGVFLEPLLIPQGLMFFLMGVASAKFWVLSLPFLATGMVLLIERFKLPHLPIIILAAVLILGQTQSVLLQPPTQSDWQAIDYALEFDSSPKNDWGMGYWILWRGGDTNSFGSLHRQHDLNEGVVITKKTLDCNLLNGMGQSKVYFC